MKVIFLGAPGAGKGTQASILAERYSIPKLSTGEMLRAAIAMRSDLGKRVKDILDSGNLVSDEIITSIIEHRIAEPDCAQGFVLDGFPRTMPQAEALDRILVEDLQNTSILFLDVDEEELIDRISGRYTCADCGKGYHTKYHPTAQNGVCDACGSTSFVIRDDDNESAVRHRLNVYRKQTEPLIAYYRGQGRLYSIDGSKSIEDITRSIEDVMKKASDKEDNNSTQNRVTKGAEMGR